MNVQVRRVSQLVLQKDHIFVDTVGLGFVETHAKVYITVTSWLVFTMGIMLKLLHLCSAL